MSYYDWRKPKLGQIVYKSFSPAKMGKIVSVGKVPKGPIWGTGHPLYRMVGVERPNGKVFYEQAGSLRCFRQLVEEHERKALKFRLVLNKLLDNQTVSS